MNRILPTEIRQLVKDILVMRGLDPGDYRISGIIRGGFLYIGCHYGYMAYPDETIFDDAVMYNRKITRKNRQTNGKGRNNV